jgi:hypothetical protein
MAGPGSSPGQALVPAIHDFLPALLSAAADPPVKPEDDVIGAGDGAITHGIKQEIRGWPAQGRP